MQNVSMLKWLLLLPAAALAEPATVIDVSAESNHIVEVDANKPIILKLPQRFAHKIVDAKISAYPVKIPRAEIPKNAYLPNYFSCFGHQAAQDPKDMELRFEAQNPASDDELGFSWFQLDKKAEAKTRLTDIRSRKRTQKPFDDTHVLYLTVAPRNKAKKIHYNVYSHMRRDSRGYQDGYQSDVEIHRRGPGEHDQSCDVPEYSVMLRLKKADQPERVELVSEPTQKDSAQ